MSLPLLSPDVDEAVTLAGGTLGAFQFPVP
jgi:hypothetical protein